MIFEDYWPLYHGLQFDWQENFQYYANLANINYDQSTPVNVLATDYLASLNSLLERTDPMYVLIITVFRNQKIDRLVGFAAYWRIMPSGSFCIPLCLS